MKPNFPNSKVTIYYGPPGTGKTHKLMDVLEEELKTVPPEEIAYTSFTREGSRQGMKRACDKFGFAQKQFPYFRTLHSIAFKQLELRKGNVLDREHYKMFSEAVGMHFTGYYTSELHCPDDRYLFFVDILRHNESYAAQYVKALDVQLAKFICSAYKKFKEEFSLMDFTDMLTMFVAADKPLPVRVAFLDEAQDFSTLMWRAVEVACRNCERIYIAGDDDQAIYQWSGADVDAFLNLEGDKHVLDKSYRLPNNILAFAQTITDQISRRVDKEYHGLTNDGEIYTFPDIDMVPMTRDGTYLFLARNNKFLASVEEFLQNGGYLYTDADGEPSVRAIDFDTIKAWKEYKEGVQLDQTKELRLKQAVGDDLSADEPWYSAFKLWEIEKVEYVQRVITRYGGKPDFKQCRIRVSTIHKVKGSEADNVVLLLGMSRPTWNEFQRNQDPEHRVFYVGATRAKKALFLVYSEDQMEYYVETTGGLCV